MRGRLYYGRCGAKGEHCFGWRLHLVITSDGIPVRFEVLPARCHDLTPIDQLLSLLPSSARVLGDKGYNSALDQATLRTDYGVQLITRPRRNLQPLPWADDYDLRHFRLLVEGFNSQLAAMGIQSLHATTHAGFDIKLHAYLLALVFRNLF